MNDLSQKDKKDTKRLYNVHNKTNNKSTKYVERREKMKFKFGKICNESEIDITITHDNGETYVAQCCYFDGQIDITGVRVIDPWAVANDENYTRLTKIVNDAYRQQSIKQQAVSHKRSVHKIAQHWWNTKSMHDKERLVTPLANKLISIVDALLEKNPKDIKRKHYESLIQRSQLVDLSVDAVLLDTKLNKLPRYDALHDALLGSDRSFIALAEVCYPARGRCSGSLLR